MDPRTVELIVLQGGSHLASERRSMSRDVERGWFIRLRRGVHVRAEGYVNLRPEGQHLLAMRAFAAVAPNPPIFSHWSAAVLHGLPVVGTKRLQTVHTTVRTAESRGRDGVTGHLLPITPGEVERVGPLWATDGARTVVDVAGAAPFSEGVVLADAAEYAGLPHDLLLRAVELAGPRRARLRIGEVVEFAHPGAQSAAESQTRVTMFRLGIAPPELQHEVWDEEGLIGYLDTWHRRQRAGGEVDGALKYLNPEFAPEGAGAVVYREKLREDRMRAQLDAFARWGWAESGVPALLRPILARIGVRPSPARPTLRDYHASARDYRSILIARRPPVHRQPA